MRQIENEPRPVHLSPREQALYFRLINKGKWVVTTQDVIQSEEISHGYARKLLHDLNRKNALVRAGQGTYAVAPPASLAEPGPPPIDPFKILDQLMEAIQRPYYAAYATAAYLHGGAHEIPMNLTIATPNRRRPIQLGPTRITFHQIPEDRMTGTLRIKESSAYLTVSDIEKTFLDCADRLDLCGGPTGLAQILWELAEQANPTKLEAYAKQDGRSPVIQRLGYVLNKLAHHEPTRVPEGLHEAIEPLRSHKSYPLDPTGNNDTNMDDTWKINVNVDILGWLDA